MALCLGLPGSVSTRKVKPIWLLLKQETVSLQWHQLGCMQVCTSLQTDNHASTPPLSFVQAGCPSCRPTNSVKALKAETNTEGLENLLEIVGLKWWQKMLVHTGTHSECWREFQMSAKWKCGQMGLRHNILQCHQRRIEPWPQTKSRENLVQTHSDCNSFQPWWS